MQYDSISWSIQQGVFWQGMYKVIYYTVPGESAGVNHISTAILPC